MAEEKRCPEAGEQFEWTPELFDSFENNCNDLTRGKMNGPVLFHKRWWACESKAYNEDKVTRIIAIEVIETANGPIKWGPERYETTGLRINFVPPGTKAKQVTSAKARKEGVK
jgi:hypothetical protein